MTSGISANLDSLDQDSRRAPERFASLLGLWSAGSGPLYLQLAETIGRLIETGVLRDREILPPERSLASAIGVARGTVVGAYGRLAEQDLVERIRGSGTRVIGSPPTAIETTQRMSDPLFEAAPRAINLLVATPRVLDRVLDRVERVDLRAHRAVLDDTDPAGLDVLRRRIAERMTADGLPTSPAQVLVTAGAQHAILLITMLLVRPGDVVLCEETTWPGLVDNVSRLGGRTHPVAMDRDGIVVDELRQAIERFRPAFIALNPHHHNPTGTRLSPDRRRAAAKLAADWAVPLIEDRVVAPLAFDGQVPPPLAAEVDVGNDRARHIVVDSVSKTAWPGLRVGWLRADSRMVAELRSRRALTDLYSPIHAALAAIEVLDDLDAIIDERTAQLRRRADLVVDRLAEQLPDWRFERPRGGLVVWVELPEASAADFAAHAARFGVSVASGRQFGSGTDDRHIRIPYTASEAELDEGIQRLAQAWHHFDRDRPSPYQTAAIV